MYSVQPLSRGEEELLSRGEEELLSPGEEEPTTHPFSRRLTTTQEVATVVETALELEAVTGVEMASELEAATEVKGSAHKVAVGEDLDLKTTATSDLTHTWIRMGRRETEGPI